VKPLFFFFFFWLFTCNCSRLEGPPNYLANTMARHFFKALLINFPSHNRARHALPPEFSRGELVRLAVVLFYGVSDPSFFLGPKLGFTLPFHPRRPRLFLSTGPIVLHVRSGVPSCCHIILYPSVISFFPRIPNELAFPPTLPFSNHYRQPTE